jgi:hypothetical protein
MFLVKVCEALSQAKVPYAIVGGFAVALHGIPRGTIDIDFVIKWTYENLRKTEEVLNKLGLISRIPVNAANVFNFRDEYIKNKNMIAWNFFDPKQLQHEVDIIITYDLSKAKTKTIGLSSGKIKVLSVEDLIRMKKASGRPQDIEDVKSLEQL